MSNRNQAELNSIREIVSCHMTSACKLDDYANKCTDPQIKQMFSQSAQSARQSASKLTNML
ncbi:MAG: hypothetical protein FWF57_07300 [Defluviitaleaceae bacterium]|nr:hypothetical protein [Defluviitaleaceae bacterium]